MFLQGSLLPSLGREGGSTVCKLRSFAPLALSPQDHDSEEGTQQKTGTI